MVYGLQNGRHNMFLGSLLGLKLAYGPYTHYFTPRLSVFRLMIMTDSGNSIIRLSGCWF